MSEYINANELKECIEKELKTAYVFDKYDSGRRDTLNWILYSVIAELSAADVAPVDHGRWTKDIDNKRKWDRVRYYCSSCGDWQTYGEPKYCPNRGAKMNESEKSGNE